MQSVDWSFYKIKCFFLAVFLLNDVVTFILYLARCCRYYGTVTWVAVQRITLPVCIFFRSRSCSQLRVSSRPK